MRGDLAVSSAALLESLTANQEFPAATLYLVPTPLGNLADITLRALACLQRVDLVAAEDTRNTKRLLAQYGLNKPLVALHQHNEQAQAEAVVARLREGQRVAYVSDAGTPAISDPGTRLVESVHNAGLRVMPLPGACALTCALSASGLSEGPFLFAGFLPPKRNAARAAIVALADLSAQLVFYEAPHRIAATLQLLCEVLGDERRIVVARELTKLHESIDRMTLRESVGFVSARPEREKGEFVIVVEGAPERAPDEARGDTLLTRLLAALPLSEAVALAAEISGVARNTLYERALALRDQANED